MLTTGSTIQYATELKTENAKLRKEFAESRMDRDILKKPRRNLRRSPFTVRVHEREQTLLPVKLMSSVLKVARSGYYAYLAQVPSEREFLDGVLKPLIRQAHKQSRETYGSRRIKIDLVAPNYCVGLDRISSSGAVFRSSTESAGGTMVEIVVSFALKLASYNV